MHDPMTVAFDWRWVIIWHVDPERDGSDDSCGWSYPRLNARQKERLKALAWSEAYEPWFQRLRAKRNDDHVAAESLMRGAVQLVVRVLGISATWDEICAWACRFVHNPMDNFRGSLCHLPGYHTNFDKDLRSEREGSAYGLFSGIARHILRDRRPWWRHPKWHFWHWKIQIQPVLNLKRWLFSRCSRCGKGFSWGYCPSSTSWNGTGPRWFRSESNVYHAECPTVNEEQPQQNSCKS